MVCGGGTKGRGVGKERGGCGARVQERAWWCGEVDVGVATNDVVLANPNPTKHKLTLSALFGLQWIQFDAHLSGNIGYRLVFIWATVDTVWCLQRFRLSV